MIAELNTQLGLNIAIESTLKGQGEGLVVRAKPRNKVETTLIIHVYEPDEIIDRASIDGQYERYYAKQQVLDIADKIVVVRDYVALLEQSFWLKSGDNHLRPIPFATAWTIVEDVLAALVERHSKGKVHGDVRPANVSVQSGHAVLIDAGARRRLDRMPALDRLYVAPELRQIDRSEGTPEGDVYSFLRFARSVLLPFRDDPGDQRIRRLESQISWLVDASAVARPEDRPTAMQLQDAFASGNSERLAGADDVLLDGFNEAVQQNSAQQDFPRPTSPIAGSVRQDILAFPETSFVMTAEAASRLLKWRALDSKVRLVHSVNRYEPKPHNVESYVDRESLPDSIDLRWKNRIHREFYGFGLDPEHDARVESQAELSPAQRDRDFRYRRHVELATEIRRTLLDGNEFLFTEDVARAMNSAGVGAEIQSIDVVTMRRWGWFLAVPDHERWLYPSFQFDPNSGLPSPDIRRVHDLRAPSLGSEVEEWSMLSFWCLPMIDLGGKALRDYLWTENFDWALKQATSSSQSA